MLVGLAFCVAAVVIPWLFLQQFPLGGPYSTPADDLQTILMSGSIGLICLSGSAIFLIMATRARGRHARRLAALRGDLSGMPLATIQPDPDQAPDVTAQPLEVMWRMSGPSAIVGRVFIIPYGLIVFIGGIGAYIYVGIAPIFDPSMQSHPLSPREIAVSAAISCGAIAAFAGLGWYAGRMVPTLFGRPFGVRATASGIEGRTDTGAHSDIAWSEICLFEVSGAASNFSRSFSVYAPGKAVTWREYRTGMGSEYAPASATASENALRQAALLNLITARTGLEPRTLSKALRRDLIGLPRQFSAGWRADTRRFRAVLLGAGDWRIPLPHHTLRLGELAQRGLARAPGAAPRRFCHHNCDPPQARWRPIWTTHSRRALPGYSRHRVFTDLARSVSPPRWICRGGRPASRESHACRDCRPASFFQRCASVGQSIHSPLEPYPGNRARLNGVGRFDYAPRGFWWALHDHFHPRGRCWPLAQRWAQD